MEGKNVKIFPRKKHNKMSTFFCRRNSKKNMKIVNIFPERKVNRFKGSGKEKLLMQCYLEIVMTL